MFQNLDPRIKPKNFLDIIKWKYSSRPAKWPRTVPLEKSDVPPPLVTDKVRISFVGHVSFLIQMEGLNILTDPVWSTRVSPLSFLGPRRVIEPGIIFEDLPKIDLVLISHNHYDHMDIATIGKLWQRDRPLIIAPLMNDKPLKANIKDIKVTTLNWGEACEVSQKLKIYLEPAQHWSARGIFDQNKALWGTFIIASPRASICFIGDSGYNSEIFKNIGDKYPNILTGLIPIGAYEPRWFMKEIHMNPEEAILVHQDLKARYSIGSHFNVFQLADEAYNQAVEELKQARHQHNIGEDIFIIPEIGKAYWF